MSFLLVSIPRFSAAQNLVADSSFEVCKTFGDTSSIIPAAIDGNLPNWFTSNGRGDARYYNAHAKMFRCPGCPGGKRTQYRGAHSGNGYVDLAVLNIAMGERRDTFSLSFDAATLCTKLSEPLVKGEKYRIEMYVRLDSTCVYALNHIGVVLGDTIPGNYPTGDQVTALYPDGYKDSITYVQPGGKTFHTKNTKLFLYATNKWQHVSAIYTAKGGEKYLSVGGLCNETVIAPVKRKYAKFEFTPQQVKNKPKDDHNYYLVVDPNGYASIIYNIDDVSVYEIK